MGSNIVSKFTVFRCFIAGWGRDQFNGQLQSIIKKVDVPIVGDAECQARIRAAGVTTWNMDPTSFICAGGEVNKDACLVSRFYLAF